MKRFSISKVFNILTFTVLFILLSGCSSQPQKPHFLDTPNQQLLSPSADKAQVVFLEPINSIQGYFPIGLFEITGNKRTHIATTGAHSKVAISFTPGHHLLMTNLGNKAHFLNLNVEAGKRYYVLLRFIYSQGFQLRPLRLSGPSDYTVLNKKFDTWISTTRFVEKTPESDLFIEKQKTLIDKSQAAGWKSWLAKTPQERAELTLNPEDGVKE